jgi:hypothetical protein
MKNEQLSEFDGFNDVIKRIITGGWHTLLKRVELPGGRFFVRRGGKGRRVSLFRLGMSLQEQCRLLLGDH